MQITNAILHVEALLFATQDPISIAEITKTLNQAFEFLTERIEENYVQKLLEKIYHKYDSEDFCFQIYHIGGGWQFLSKKPFHKTIAVLNKDKFLKKLSNSALETLAIIAYQQPVTKAEIEAIRAVNCDYAVQKLIDKDLAVVSGRNEELPGKPLLYSTSNTFMSYFGFNSSADLPRLSEISINNQHLERYLKEQKENQYQNVVS